MYDYAAIDESMIDQIKLNGGDHNQCKEYIKSGMSLEDARRKIGTKYMYKRREELVTIWSELQREGDELHENAKEFEALFITCDNLNDLDHQRQEMSYILKVLNIIKQRRKILLGKIVKSNQARLLAIKEYFSGADMTCRISSREHSFEEKIEKVRTGFDLAGVFSREWNQYMLKYITENLKNGCGIDRIDISDDNNADENCLKSRLIFLHVNHPKVTFTNTQLRQFKIILEKKLKQIDPLDEFYPQFIHLSEHNGSIALFCNSWRTRNCLLNIIKGEVRRWPKRNLRIIEEKLKLTTLISIYIRNTQMLSVDQTLKRLTRQNPDIRIENWQLREADELDKYNYTLTFRLNVESLRILREHESRLYYNFSQIKCETRIVDEYNQNTDVRVNDEMNDIAGVEVNADADETVNDVEMEEDNAEITGGTN